MGNSNRDRANAAARRRRQELRTLAQLLTVLETPGTPTTAKLRTMHEAREALDAAIDREIPNAREEGESWSAIGAALNMSPQGASQRGAKLAHKPS